MEPPPSELAEAVDSPEWRMFHMKVLPCSKRFVHDWTECPFAHPQEKARRRDPRVHTYTGIACPSMKKEGCCAFGDHCPYAHNVFEYWLHPTRYRTQLCNDGSNCKRKICFFAHSLDELRVPACKPFVSPEALAAAAAAAANDAEAKRKAATIGSPLSAFASLSPGPSPQRSSLDSLRMGGGAGSVPAPSSPPTADNSLAGSSPGDSAVAAALAQLAGAGFSNQEQQVIELVTTLLSQDKVSPEQAASILQQMLPPSALSHLQLHLNTPRSSLEAEGMAPRPQAYSDPLGYRGEGAGQLGYRSSSFDSSPRAAHMMHAQQAAQQQAAQQQGSGLTLEHLAAMQAAQQMGYNTGMGSMPGQGSYSDYQAGKPRMSYEPRMSMESARSSFDTGAQGQQLLAAAAAAAAAAVPAPQRLSSGSSSSDGSSGGGNGRSSDAATAAVLASSQQRARAQLEGLLDGQPQQQPGAAVRPSVEAALRRMSAEEVVGSAGQQRTAMYIVQQQQMQYQRAALETAAAASQQQQQQRTAIDAALQQRRQLLQLHAGAALSEDPTRMSLDTPMGRASMEGASPRTSIDASYPPALLPTYSSQLETQHEGGLATPEGSAPLFRSMSTGFRPRFMPAQLSSVPEQFPMINAPPPSSSWSAGAGRLSLDSSADRLSQDLSRLSFEAGRVVAPTANPYTSAFFSAGAQQPHLMPQELGGYSSLGVLPGERLSAPASMGMTERRSLSLPPLPPLRTASSKSPDPAEQAGEPQLLGGTALHRMQ